VHPTLLNACAKAATAAEARFRIDRPIAGRSARVIALDEGAVAVVRRAAQQLWHDARFFACDGTSSVAAHGNGGPAEIVLRSADGATSSLSAALAGADVAIVVATSADGADAASAIAHACDVRGIMAAGLILGEALEADAAVSALRPYAPVLLVTDDDGDLSELLTALRA
jgi:hypothetical protein